jgi:dTDP-4-amino-4,6-dideoxygalactose transaminase
MTPCKIPFNRPRALGKEFTYIREAIDRSHLSGDGAFTRQCHGWLEARTGCRKALLTHSCTAALEMAAILAGFEPGDEVIMPSFTFVSTANACVLRGAVPVFVDVRPDTLNLDETKIEAAITPRTRAIVPVHYAGVGCAMDAILGVAMQRNLLVIEDAAQGLLATYKHRPLGSLGHMGTLSFHETKVLISGEGGALLINDSRWNERAEIIREKGTNRSQFFRGEVAKYTWVDIGSSYLPSEIIAAFLWAQFEEAEAAIRERLRIWDTYHEAFADLERQGRVRRPVVPPECEHNGHIYYLLLPRADLRTAAVKRLGEQGINAVFHYVPLHSSPAGRRFGRPQGSLTVTEDSSARLIRLPLWLGMTDAMVGQVVEAVAHAC